MTTSSRERGRPAKISPSMTETVLKLHAEGKGVRRIADEMGVGKTSVVTVLDKAKDGTLPPPPPESAVSAGVAPPAPEASKKPVAKPDKKKTGPITVRPTAVDPIANLIVSPQRPFTVNSTLIWFAKQIAEREWGWPEYEIGDFIDTFLYYSLRNSGYNILAYEKIPTKLAPVMEDPDGFDDEEASASDEVGRDEPAISSGDSRSEDEPETPEGEDDDDSETA